MERKDREVKHGWEPEKTFKNFLPPRPRYLAKQMGTFQRPGWPVVRSEGKEGTKASWLLGLVSLVPPYGLVLKSAARCTERTLAAQEGMYHVR